MDSQQTRRRDDALIDPRKHRGTGRIRPGVIEFLRVPLGIMVLFALAGVGAGPVAGRR
ncbi:hypothetical protein FHX82_005143 [Amycolatopsis bartoniae]|uniref:Uncharacterized protein n=1 Tax=Amycolatopsis bartoniae TaxID=941986 RepID=A0A8H9M2P1_9PSEU|nr:hypothetical protein [Amycolatopsis bartoniae]MBB2938067.1 hypothetical protein [Amycolatopsis bartoniae]GHF32449.1 hypothetical protein GCM10017566_01250 [Amycolatopsis bartoniae]